MDRSKLPTKNILFIILFGGGILLFVLLSIFPNYIAYSNIENEINAVRQQIEEQKILSPIFTDLSDKTKFENPENLPFPKKEKLSKNETGNISAIIQDIIRQNDFKLDSILTDVGGLMNGSGMLEISLEMTGDFINLRNMILQFGTLPYLEHIETIRIENTNKKQKVSMKLWIAQEQ
ncbi:MAG: hypothetical protein DRH90_02480 [Deltaproteobacteria bacterium]|nr:MAG: hypothetical protein DRH90_02480 [Deltaproteobacteria bacterium]RLC14713.1 MAG: hypothetical protein DRI24_12785 [Deltaproteobacteria bacterium]